MAGHSQFKNIMHRKGRQDKARSKLFSKLSKEITIAAKMGMPDPDMNPRLRLAVQNARAENMPKDNIKRAIDKASAAGGEAYEDIRYEGFGPGGVGVIVEASTDNKNRAAMEVRTAFSKNGGNMGETGSVAFMFDQVGEIAYPPDIGGEEAVLEAAVEAGAEDVESSEDGHWIYTARDDLAEVAAALEKSFGEARSVKIVWKPQNTIPVDDAAAPSLMKLLEQLEDCDDVQNVYANFELSDEQLASLDA